MYPIHDHDPLVLLATALAAKRRPAALLEIMAAIDLIQGNIPNEAKLSEAFARLGQSGLLVERDDGVALTPAAETAAMHSAPAPIARASLFNDAVT